MGFLPTRLATGVEAVRRRYLARPALDGLDVWVVSPGGVGTTFLMEYIAQFLRINHPHDDDGLKHWPRPPRGAQLATPPRMLFITGDPEAIAASIARRDWIATQSLKLGSLGGTVLAGPPQYAAFLAAVRGQIDAWTALADSPEGARLMVVAYDDLWDRAAEIGAHLGLDAQAFAADFPPRRTRQSAPAGPAGLAAP